MVLKESALSRYRREQAAFRTLIGVGAAKDILVLTREEFDRKRTVGSSSRLPSSGKAFCSIQPETAAETRAWFQNTTNDLRGADIDLAAAPPLIEDALFHRQQAAEKAMKGDLTAHERVFRKRMTWTNSPEPVKRSTRH